jgi:hypothetical protein
MKLKKKVFAITQGTNVESNVASTRSAPAIGVHRHRSHARASMDTDPRVVMEVGVKVLSFIVAD